MSILNLELVSDGNFVTDVDIKFDARVAKAANMSLLL